MGLLGRFEGNWPRAALMAACTSRAAASMLRLRSNCRTMFVEPSWLVEVISVTPAMRPNWRSSGVATADAMVSGLAPGRPAWTWMVGNSTWGRGATGRKRKASTPAIATARVSSDVVTGRLMKVEEITGLLRRQREVNHHDGVLLDDADQQDDADERDHAELRVADQQRQNGPDPGGGECGEDGDGMDVALIKYAQDDVDGDQGSENQQGLVRERVLEGLSCALELGVDRGGQAHVSLGPLNRLDGVA